MSSKAHIAVVSPAGPCEPEALRLGLAWLETEFDLSTYGLDADVVGYRAGSVQARLRAFRQALASPEATHVLCTRGGFGSMELLPFLQSDEVARSGKTLIGLSDITALHLLWARAGIPSVHASMLAMLGTRVEERAMWLRAVGGERSDLVNLDTITEGECEGPLVGGNLSVLAALAAGPCAPSFDGCVLFLEDVGERAYRIDRLLLSLRLRGVFDGLAGVVLGSFTDCFESAGVTTDDVLQNTFKESPFPVLSGAPCGHGEMNLPLHFGQKVRLASGSLRYIECM